MKKTIGILGGMGPLATADLMTKIVTMTKADSDQEHVRVFVDCNTAIPDRTGAILHGGKDPVPEMTSALRNLERCGADCIIMPCNTAHYFLPRLQSLTTLPILHMPKISARRCADLYPGRKVCVLATTGTLSVGLYDTALREAGVPYLVPDEPEQQILMHLIYDVVKASLPLEPEEPVWQDLLNSLRAKGAEVFLLACTELPILAGSLHAPGPFIDPTAELARAAILYCGYPVRER